MDVTFLDPFDTADLDRLATMIDEYATAIGARAGQLIGAVGSTRWASPGATCFRARAADVTAGMRRAVELLRTAARTLREHARTVRSVLDAIRTAERLVETAAEAGADAAGHTVRSISSTIHSIGRYL